MRSGSRVAKTFLSWITAIVLLAGAPLAFAQPPLTMEPGTNRKGSDYRNFDLPRPDPQLCREQCARDPNCRAYTYVVPGHQGPHARCWLKNAVPPPNPEQCCTSGAREAHYGAPHGSRRLTMEPGTNRKGSDYSNFDLPRPDPQLCRERCAEDPNCRAYTYVVPGHQGPHARCWLKNAVPPPNPEQCCTSGVHEDNYGGRHGFRRLTMEHEVNRKGSDYSNFDLPGPDPELCRERCAQDPQCRAYTYVKPGHQGSHARCWLKNAVPPPNREHCCISGVHE